MSAEKLDEEQMSRDVQSFRDIWVRPFFNIPFTSIFVSSHHSFLTVGGSFFSDEAMGNKAVLMSLKVNPKKVENAPLCGGISGRY